MQAMLKPLGLTFLITFCFCQIVLGQYFEGELVYEVRRSGEMKVMDSTISYEQASKERSDYFETLSIVIKGSNFTKIFDMQPASQDIVLGVEKKKYTIKEKELTIDDLSYEGLFDRQTTYFGEVIDYRVSDTLHGTSPAKKLVVERSYAKETYVFSDYIPPLSFKRNLLNVEECQVYDAPLSAIIGHNVLLMYTVEPGANKNNIKTTFTLASFRTYKVQDSVFEIPEHKSEKGFRSYNRKKGRFKFYEIIEND